MKMKMLKAEIEELKRISKITGAGADESFELGHRGSFAVAGIHEEGKDRQKKDEGIHRKHFTINSISIEGVLHIRYTPGQARKTNSPV